jgi:hypothetical protein
LLINTFTDLRLPHSAIIAYLFYCKIILALKKALRHSTQKSGYRNIAKEKIQVQQVFLSIE